MCTIVKDVSNDIVPSDTPELISLNLFAAQSGISPVTLWRWRRAGILETINVYGRQYISREQLTEFKRRAVAGEFAQEHKTPKRAQRS